MKVEKKLTVTLNEVDVENIQTLLAFCNILSVKKSDEKLPKGFEDYQINNAYNLFEILIDL